MTKNAWDSNFVSVCPTYIAVAWQVGGGGAVGVFPVNKPGKLDNPGLFSGHASPVLDLAFNPFNDRILATVSEDCYGKVWEIPKEGHEGQRIDNPAQNLKGHQRKVGALEWNGVADNVLATAGTDYDLKIWDVSCGKDVITVGGHGGIIQSLNWNYTGSQVVTYCKDKKMRIIDPRGSDKSEVETHQGVKGGRAIWMGKHDKIVSVGFSKNAEREYIVYDARNLSAPLTRAGIDNSAGVLMPFYDEDSELLFLAGKGDGKIGYYELDPTGPANEMVNFVSNYSSNEPTGGCGYMPKRGCDVSTNEIVRLYKQTGQVLQPLSFKVPRKSDMFQDDIFPPCRSDEPAFTHTQWFSAEKPSGPPKTKSLEGGFAKSDRPDASFSKVEEEKPLSEEELRKAHGELSKRVAYLEAELAKAHAKIKELESQH